jgi:4'-phosphopantetheinyl transferase
VHIYRLQLSANASAVPQALPLLSAEETVRARGYFHQRDTDRFILSGAALRLILSRYIDKPAKEIVFTIGENKKPFVRASTNTQYNISHAGDWVVIGISNEPVGVDVEMINPDYDYPAVLDVTFSPEEIRHVKDSADPLNTFYLLWTRKEALVKATCKGMDDDFKLIPSLDGRHRVAAEKIGSKKEWSTNSFPIGQQHIASVAHDPAIQKISFFEADSLVKDLS